MGKKSSRTLAAAIAAGALIAIPATASASPERPSAADVRSYTVKSDNALDRAVVLFSRGKERHALKSFRLSRAYLGKAKALAAGLAEDAESTAARTRAASAWRFLALERDQNIARLVKLLERVDAQADGIVARALLADTKHREAAIAMIQGLIDAGVSPAGEAVMNRLITALASGRAAEIGAQVGALAETELPPAAQQAVAKAIQSNLGAQARVAVVLDTLIPQLPEDQRAHLQKALDVARAQLAAAADMMDGVAAMVPPFVRPLIQGILADVQRMMEAITAPWLGPPSAPAPPPPAPPAPATPGAPLTPWPFPVPMPSWVMDLIEQHWPGGVPGIPAGFPMPGMEGFWEAFFGPDGFMSGFFGPGGFMGGGSGTGSGGMFGGMFGGGAG